MGDQVHPLVYITFGSVAAGLPPFAGIYRSVLDALSGEPLRVLMTTGSCYRAGITAPLPANARVEQWRPQASVLPHTTGARITPNTHSATSVLASSTGNDAASPSRKVMFLPSVKARPCDLQQAPGGIDASDIDAFPGGEQGGVPVPQPTSRTRSPVERGNRRRHGGACTGPQ